LLISCHRSYWHSWLSSRVNYKKHMTNSPGFLNAFQEGNIYKGMGWVKGTNKRWWRSQGLATTCPVPLWPRMVLMHPSWELLLWKMAEAILGRRPSMAMTSV
jgi:hypothetical protein